MCEKVQYNHYPSMDWFVGAGKRVEIGGRLNCGDEQVLDVVNEH